MRRDAKPTWWLLDVIAGLLVAVVGLVEISVREDVVRGSTSSACGCGATGWRSTSRRIGDERDPSAHAATLTSVGRARVEYRGWP